MNLSLQKLLRPAAVLLVAGTFATGAAADATLLNASYDVARELYKDYNQAFVKYWKAKTGENLTINQSHGPSSKQAMSVVAGLEADVVTMNQSNDVDLIAERGKLLPADWRKRLPYNAAPYYSTQVFLVRKGNPRHIKDWDDLVKPGVQVVVPNPKTAGNGRYTYLGAWGYAVKKGGDEAQAREFVGKLFKNVPVLDAGGRAATTTFTQRGIGDVLVTFENEVLLIRKQLAGGEFEIVYPSMSIQADLPVAVVDKVADKKGTRKLAEAYVNYLYSDEGQDIIARHHMRPRAEAVLAKYKADFKPIQLFTVDDVFGGWQKAQKTHFDDGGYFDQIYAKK